MVLIVVTESVCFYKESRDEVMIICIVIFIPILIRGLVCENISFLLGLFNRSPEECKTVGLHAACVAEHVEYHLDNGTRFLIGESHCSDSVFELRHIVEFESRAAMP